MKKLIIALVACLICGAAVAQQYPVFQQPTYTTCRPLPGGGQQCTTTGR